MASQQQHTYVGGEIVTFVSYGQLPEGEEPLLQAGDRLRVIEVQEDGLIVTDVIDAEGKTIEGRQGDTLFPEEVSLVLAAPQGQRAATEDAGQPAKVAKTKAPKAAPKVAPKVAPKAAVKAPLAKATSTKAPAPRARTAADSKAAKPKVTKAKAKKAAPAPKVEAPKVEVKHDPEVLSLIEKNGALKAAQSLVLEVETAYFHLGGVLMEINDKDLHTKAGYETGLDGFREYVRESLGVEYRKAMYLIGIYEVFRDPRVLRKLTPTRLAQLGWSKAKELARLGADQLYENWDDIWGVATGKGKTRDDLTAHIAEHYKVVQRGTGERVPAVRLKFALIGDGASTVQQALAQAQTLVGEEDPNKALEYICGEWLQLTSGVERETFESVEDLIARANQQFKVKLVAAK